MKPEPKRARRIRDLERMKAKAIRVYGPRLVNIKLANHLAHCSSWCCGNERRIWGKPTMQELRAPVCEAA